MNTELQTILLKAKEDVYSHLSGGNLSRILGQGYDFAELRAYERSDDIRHISWINSAKLGQPYVKKMHEDRELNVAVCSMVDGRFLVGNKQELLSYVLAVLGYSAYEENDLFSAFLLLGSELKSYEATKNIYAIEKMIQESYEADLLGKRVDCSKVENIYLESKSLLFVMGDFLDVVDLSLLAKQHEVVVIMIRDASEENPKVLVNHQLINPQSNQPIHQTLSRRAIEHYKAKLEEHDEQLMEHFHQHQIRYTKIDSMDKVLGKLEQLFIN
ncbi:DUF58 domain-containing protein [bacterium]|nr:DUF58 domain-containing protein [bacterium]